jgi:hypothetical protein
MPLDYCRDLEACDKILNQRPGDRSDAGRLGGVAIQSGGDCIGPGGLRGDCIFDGSDVCADGATQLAVDAADSMRSRVCFEEPAVGAVERDDIRTCVADSLGGFEIGRYVDVTVRVIGFDDSDDR